jgi:hypothetical protein
VDPRASGVASATAVGAPPFAAAAPVRATPFPDRAAIRAARRYARRRGGLVSFAVVDTLGRLNGHDLNRRYVTASVVKAMLLIAELRRLSRDGRELDSDTRALLTAMITRSDNDAADSIFRRVGDDGLLDVARSARMRRFKAGGYWANAQVSAADLARLFARLRRQIPRPHRRTALHMLSSIVRDQRWGVPRSAGRAWVAHFKGGWRATGRGELVHQAVRLHRNREKVAIAVLTDAQPSRLYAIHTVRGVADRLLKRAR